MKIIVPLAGPDFDRCDGQVKAEIDVGGRPLLRRTLEGRPWWRAGQAGPADLIFIVRDTPSSQRFARDVIPIWYPGCVVVTIGQFARGAAFSALAGVAMIQDHNEPICVDLVDIDYRSTLDPIARFAISADVGGIALVFPSDNPLYSYLRTDGYGRVVEAAEKRVISANASAGTYFFSNSGMYLTALAHSLSYADTLTHRGLFFVCPLMNGVVAAGLTVEMEDVFDVVDIKISA